MKKKKVIVLSDHALSTSGVGTQTRHLLNGLIEKGEWTHHEHPVNDLDDFKRFKINIDDMTKKTVF